MKQKKIPTILIIAGSDSGGGAGIQADIKAASYFKVFATTAVTAVTAQNTLGVQSIFPIPEIEIQKQLRSVIGDLAPDLIKIGMLGTKEVVDCVAQEILPNKIILDPVMVATSGDKLVDGTGCTLSTAIASSVAKGNALEKAITDSISYVQRGIKNAPNLGSGNGPLMHFDV